MAEAFADDVVEEDVDQCACCPGSLRVLPVRVAEDGGVVAASLSGPEYHGLVRIVFEAQRVGDAEDGVAHAKQQVLVAGRAIEFADAGHHRLSLSIAQLLVGFDPCGRRVGLEAGMLADLEHAALNESQYVGVLPIACRQSAMHRREAYHRPQAIHDRVHSLAALVAKHIRTVCEVCWTILTVAERVTSLVRTRAFTSRNPWLWVARN